MISPDALVDILLGEEVAFDTRYIPDEDLPPIVDALRKRDLSVVFTSGSWDMFHPGHARYLQKARALGDFLIVGVDSDRLVRERKGPNRPIDPELARLEIVAHQRGVGIVTPVLDSSEYPNWENWYVVKTVHPDALLVEADVFTERELGQLRQFCGHLVTYGRTANTSTTDRICSIQSEFLRHLKTEAPSVARPFLNHIANELVSSDRRGA